jgi:hypothetical protein
LMDSYIQEFISTSQALIFIKNLMIRQMVFSFLDIQNQI